MLKNTIGILVLSLLTIACNDSVNIKKPDNLISKDKMSDILYDLYTVNASKGVNKKLLESNGLMPETYVLTKYNIDSTQFADSNTYYSFDIETYKAIVEKVKTRLEKEKEKYEKIKEKEDESFKKRRDSIKKSQKKSKDSIKKEMDSSRGKIKKKKIKVDSTFLN